MNNTKDEYIPQPLIYLNRSNHSPNTFRSYNPGYKLPPMLNKAFGNAASSYFDLYCYDIGKYSFHFDKCIKNGRRRQVRSEAREALSRICQWLIARYNEKTKMIGYTRNGIFIPWNLKKMKSDLNMFDDQAQQIINLLKNNNYMNIVTNIKKSNDGSYRNVETFITLNQSFFKLFGITDEEYNHHLYAKRKRDEMAYIDAIQRKNFLSYKKSKKDLKQNFKNYLIENPGANRKRTEAKIYSDYTGISQDKDSNRALTSNANQPIRHILDFLKKPPLN